MLFLRGNSFSVCVLEGGQRGERWEDLTKLVYSFFFGTSMDCCPPKRKMYNKYGSFSSIWIREFMEDKWF
jgi:hypothetical protein